MAMATARVEGGRSFVLYGTRSKLYGLRTSSTTVRVRYGVLFWHWGGGHWLLLQVQALKRSLTLIAFDEQAQQQG